MGKAHAGFFLLAIAVNLVSGDKKEQHILKVNNKEFLFG